MKRCPNCNKEYYNGNFCTVCGVRLVENEVKFDIFGDPISEEKKENKVTILDENGNNIIVESDSLIAEENKGNIKPISKFMTLISIGALFIPLFGTIIPLVALILNILTIKTTNDKRHIPYFVISLIALILSIIFIALLIKSGVLADLTSDAVNGQ